tara:strand:+ start:26082 stop:27422 length:1341 start_codon:yes stop_codon:yes gene_type:complete
LNKKNIIDLAQIKNLIKSGDTIIVGGFGMTGTPIHLLNAISESGITSLTYIGNNIGEPGLGGGKLLRNGQIKKVIGSFFTTNPEVYAAYQSKELQVDLLPQGTLIEAIRAGGSGIKGFYVETGANTDIDQGKSRNIDGIKCIFQKGIRADVALIRAWKADTAGNIFYRMTENNFNQVAATAADIVIAEVEEIVPVGSIKPEEIHTPGLFIDYLVQAKIREEDLGTSVSVEASDKKVDERRLKMAQSALRELHPGDVVNLGIGIPTLVADLIKPSHEITLHSENGMLGVGPSPSKGGAMDYPVNAGKIPVTSLPGSSYFDSSSSFSMIRGGHIDVAIMGGLQVDESANIANWSIPGKPLFGIGGAMDLALGAKKLIITMMHEDKKGLSKVVSNCSLPITAFGCVSVIITDLGKFRFENNQLLLVEIMPHSSIEEIISKTDANFEVFI